MNLVNDCLANLPNFDDDVHPFSTTPYDTVGSDLALANQVTEFCPPTNALIWQYPQQEGHDEEPIRISSHRGDNPPEDSEHFDAVLIPTTLGTLREEENKVYAYRLPDAGPEYMITARLGGCTFFVFEWQNHPYACHVQPSVENGIDLYSQIRSGPPFEIDLAGEAGT